MIGRPIIFIALLLTIQIVFASDDEDAIHFAESWFTLIDQKEFELAWDGLTSTSQKAEIKRNWLWGIAYIHEQIGSIDSRAMTDQRFEHDSLGNIGFAVFDYESKYALRPIGVETLRLGKENGAWRIITYELRDPGAQSQKSQMEPQLSQRACKKPVAADTNAIASLKSLPELLLTEFLSAVATGNYSAVERFRLIQDQRTLNQWRKPECFELSTVIDVRSDYPDNRCFRNDELLIKVLEINPDDVSYYSMRRIDGEWTIVGFRSEDAFDSCLPN